MYANASKMKPIPEEESSSSNWREKLNEDSSSNDEEHSSEEDSSSGSSDGYESDWEREGSEVTGEVFFVDPFTQEELTKSRLKVSHFINQFKIHT